MGESIDSRLSIFPAGTSNRSPNSAFSPFGLGLQETLAYRKRFRGLIGVSSKISLKDHPLPSLLYTPGGASPSLAIAEGPLSPFAFPIPRTTPPSPSHRPHP